MLFCQCPKLTPLQSRFLASATALAILALIYWSMSDFHFAYAAELALDGSGQVREGMGGEDHNWHRIELEMLEADGIELDQDAAATPVLEARAATTSTTAGNSMPNNDNILPGETTVWMFPEEQLMSRDIESSIGLDSSMPSEHAELRRRHNAYADDEHENEDNHSSLHSRQGGSAKRIFVSINTCLQPAYAGSGVQSAPPPQLTLYVSTEAQHTSPGPNANPSLQRAVPLDEGYANFSTIAVGDWYMAVHAPERPSDFTNVWNYELAVSVDDYYHSLGTNGSNLYLIDSDSNAALLVTNNLTQANSSSPVFQHWMDRSPPYIVFASNANHTAAMGLAKSYCGLTQNSQVIGKLDDITGDTTNVQMEMITRGIGDKPKQQFYITFLNSSSTYHAVLAEPADSSAGQVGGGGRIWEAMSFPTKADGNCALLYNLDFCDQVAYAVPSNPDIVTDYPKFQQFYDDYARNYYHNFNYSLQQIPCHAESASQYSLAKNCSGCASAYKEWLCAVSIPRCEDFSNPAPYLQFRNVGQSFLNGSMLPDQFLQTKYVPMHNAPTLEGSQAYQQTYLSSIATNSSRNRKIDSEIAPGPYKEVLPCEDLCYSLVQNCPAALGFGCPHPGRGLETSYGTRRGLKDGLLTCSYLGAYVYTDDAWGLGANMLFVWASAGIAVMLVTL